MFKKERGGHGGELISWSKSQMNSSVCSVALAKKTNNKEANGMVKRADERGGELIS